MSKKVGVILPYQNGDLLLGTSVLRYREELWPNSEIVWFTDDPHSALLSSLDLHIRPFPHGWDISPQEKETLYLERINKDRIEGKLPWENWKEAMTKDGRLNQEVKHKFPLLADLDEAYFAASWMFSPVQRHGLTYPEVSQKVFGCQGKEWHPVIRYSLQELEEIDEWIEIFKGPKVFIESFAGSGQSSLDEGMIEKAMNECDEIYGKCTFFFGSHKFLRNQEEFPIFAKERGIMLGMMSIRKAALVATKCDFMISVSSGITCATSAWGMCSPPMLQLCGSETCGTRLIANGPFEMVTADGKQPEQYKQEFFDKLKLMLNRYEPVFKI